MKYYRYFRLLTSGIEKDLLIYVKKNELKSENEKEKKIN